MADNRESPGQSRKLSVILAADAAGYSRLMAADEAATLAALNEARGVFRLHIEHHRGRIIDTARADIADYLNWYNTHRPHSSPERLTPHQKYLAALPQLKLAA